MMNLIEFSHYDFIQNAFIAGTFIALLAGVVGYFVVLQRLSFTSHALGHIGFAGAAGASLLGLSWLTGQLWFTLIAAMLMVFFEPRLQKNDAAIGIILAFSLGLGSLFLYFTNHYAGNMNQILFGDLFSVGLSGVWQIAGLSVACLIVLGIMMRPLWFSALLPELAGARGLPVRLLQYIFFAVLAIAMTLISQAVGILLIFTLLVGPPAIAMQCSQRFWPSILLSIGLNLMVIYAALIISIATNWPLSFWISALVFVAYGVMQVLRKL